MYKCIYFEIKEFVSQVVYNYYTKIYGIAAGESLMWSFFDARFLQDVDTIREEHGSGIIINDWASGGQYQESGLRCNIDSLVKGKTTPYCGGHNLAKAGDLKDAIGVKNTAILQARNAKLHTLVCSLVTNGKLKVIRRVENLKSTPTWTHTDSFQTPNDKLVIF